MSESQPVSIFSRQLETQYRAFSQHAEFGASDHLYQLQNLAWKAYAGEQAARKVICFVLSTVFGRLASAAEGGAVTVDAARATYEHLDQAIKECVDYLASPSAAVGVDVAHALSNLLSAYDRVNPSPD